MIVSVVKLNSLKYTPEGIQRLKKVVQASLRQRRWTVRKFTAEVQKHISEINQQRKSRGEPPFESKGSHTTINRYVSLDVEARRLSDEVLQAMAPFIYRVLSINGDEIVLDTSVTYAEDWIQFARLATNDFTFPEDVYTQQTMEPTETPLARFIQYWCERQNPSVSMQEFELRLQQATDMDLERFRAIVASQVKPSEINEDDLVFIGFVVRNERGKAYTLDELKAISLGLTDPTQEDRNGKPNGAHASS